MTVTRIFLLKNVRVNGDWRYLSKLRRYHLVDLVVKHECEMVSVSYKFNRTGCCSSKLQSTATSCQNRLDIMYQGVGMLSFNNYS